MPKFRKTLAVDVSPESAWRVVGDLTVMGRLAGAADVQIDDMTRVCTMPNGAIQHETISNYSTDAHSYNYANEGSPLPVENNRGLFAIASEGGHTAVVWEAEFELVDPSQAEAIGTMWQGAMDQVLQAIRRRIEEEAVSAMS